MLLGANDPDRDWEWFGATDPYFGVLTHDRFRQPRLTADALGDFFRSGEQHVDALWDAVRRHISPDFAPQRALDFGCGVGRVLLPLSRRCAEVVGVDVSASMLAEAVRNCDAQGISNVEFVVADDRLSRVDGDFDFVHSFIVFQHIPVTRGEELTRRLLALLQPGGVAALHYTYRVEIPRALRAYTWVKVHVPLVQPLVNLLKRRPRGFPLMQMNEYSITRLVRLLHDAGCDEICTRATRHGDDNGSQVYGILLICRKDTKPSL